MLVIQLIGRHPELSRLLEEFFAEIGRSSSGETEWWKVVSCRQPTLLPLCQRRDTTTVLVMLEDCPELSLEGWNLEQLVAIASAENTRILRLLQRYPIGAIPCGLSAHNTFTLTSDTRDSLVVSLQRSILSCTGQTVEPMELPVQNPTARSLSRYPLMAFCAVGCLAGESGALTRFLAREE